MPDVHLSMAALRHFFQSPDANGDEIVSHLLVCRTCWGQAAQCLVELKRLGSFSPSPLGAAVARLGEGEKRQSESRLRARGAVLDLRGLMPSEQRKKVKSVRGLQTRTFVEALLDESEAQWHSDPIDAERIALLAAEVAQSLPSRHYDPTTSSDLLAHSLMYAGNCRRLGANFAGARSSLTTARKHLNAGAGDNWLLAMWYSMSATLAMDLGQFETALGLLERAAKLYRTDGDGEGLAFIKIQEGNLLLASYKPEEALGRANAALLIPGLFPRLEMLARSIAVEALVDLNQGAEAMQRFTDAKSFFRQFPESAPRVLYLEAKLLECFGDHSEAENRFREAGQSFLETENYKDAFLAFLSLFEHYRGRGDFPKATALCQEVLSHSAYLEGRPAIVGVWESLLAYSRARTISRAQVLTVRGNVSRFWSNSGTTQLFEERLAEDSATDSERVVEPEDFGSAPVARPIDQEVLFGDAYHEALADKERELFTAAFRKCNLSVRGTAKALEISRTKVRQRALQYGLKSSD